MDRTNNGKERTVCPKCGCKEGKVKIEYCSGINFDVVEGSETIQCEKCGWMRTQVHVGHYVQDSKSELKKDEPLKECQSYEVR